MTLFKHGVASGDPETDRAVIWTRVTPEGKSPPGSLTWTVWRDAAALDELASGTAPAHADDDFTVQVDVEGLEPDTHYWYGFENAGGDRSPVGRLRTLPGPDVQHLRFGVVSCAKFNSGFFNGYGRLAERDDLNFVLHLGDYIYEASQTPPASQTPGADIGRPFDPLHECKTLDDYRRRYAQYRADPDTQACTTPTLCWPRSTTTNSPTVRGVVAPTSTSPSAMDRGISAAAPRSRRAVSGCPRDCRIRANPIACSARSAWRRSPTCS